VIARKNYHLPTMSKKIDETSEFGRRIRLHRKLNGIIRRLIRCRWLMLKHKFKRRDG
jgi:hypothetical protein